MNVGDLRNDVQEVRWGRKMACLDEQVSAGSVVGAKTKKRDGDMLK